MRDLLRPGTLVLTLGIGLVIGCTASSDSPTQAPPSQPRAREDSGQAVKSEKSAAPSKVAKSEKAMASSERATPREYVLTVEGMT